MTFLDGRHLHFILYLVPYRLLDLFFFFHRFVFFFHVLFGYLKI